METSSPFDLNQALWRWRAGLQNHGGICAADLEELESHLRESISALHARGLSIEEAFMVASRRLGSERQLADEFAKANPQRTWTERAMWMVAGVLAAYTLTVVAMPFRNILLNCVFRSGLNGHVVAALHLLAGWMAWAGGAAIAYWALSRHSMRRDRVVQACMQRPVWTGLGLFLGLEWLAHYWPRNMMILAEPMMNFFGPQHVAPNPQTMAIMTSWSLWEFHLTELLWVAAVPLLAGYAWRKREQLAASGSPIPYELQPGEDDAAHALQGQGFSLGEVSLVLARRRCPQEVVAPSVARVTNRGIWLGRAVWMVTGVALSHCLQWLVLQPALIVAATSGPAAPLLQHLAGLVSVSLGLTLAGAIIAGLWRWITRHPRQSASIGRVCRLRPVAAAMALVMVCAGIGFGEYALFTQVILPANLGIGAIGSQWMMYGDALTYLLIPIILLLWLARRWRSIQTNPAPCH